MPGKTPLDLLQTIMVEGCPTVEDVISGRYKPPESEVVLIVLDGGVWRAAGPFPTNSVDWKRLPISVRIYDCLS